MSDLTNAINAADLEKCRTGLQKILDGASKPAFGAVTKRELELLLFEIFIDVGFLSNEPTVYEVMQKLRVTRGRARSFLFDRDVRRHDELTLNRLAKQALRKPLLQSQGYAVVLDIENPLLADHLREMLRKLGHATDGSFSPTLVKINDEAAAALVENYVEEADKKSVLKALHKAGVEDKSIKGAIKKLLRSGANKMAGEAGGMISEKPGELLEAVFEAKSQDITVATFAYMEKTSAR
jgi:hypothetical protein